MAGSRVLTVGVGPTFATRWLIPRLADFQKEAPDVEVRFATGGATVPYNDDWTCGIRLGDGDWPDLSRSGCSPPISRRCARRDGEAAEVAGRLEERDAAARRARGDDWPRWFKAAGLSRCAPKGPEFEYYGQALQAAADGVGVAMGIRPYVDDDLKAGRLVAPFAQSVSKGEQWYLIYRDVRSTEPAFAAFRAWLMEAAGGANCLSPQSGYLVVRLNQKTRPNIAMELNDSRYTFSSPQSRGEMWHLHRIIIRAA